jgi:hypothetical protein
MGMGHTSILNYLKAISNNDVANYPETLGTTIVVNAPAVFPAGECVCEFVCVCVCVCGVVVVEVEVLVFGSVGDPCACYSLLHTHYTHYTHT